MPETIALQSLDLRPSRPAPSCAGAADCQRQAQIVASGRPIRSLPSRSWVQAICVRARALPAPSLPGGGSEGTLEAPSDELDPVEHPEDDDAGDGNVEPQRERPARDPHVTNELRRRPPPDRRERQGHDRRRQHDVGDQQREIHRPGPSLPRERPRARVPVVEDVGDEEERRDAEGAEHARDGSGPAPPPDEAVPRREQCRAHAVERGVEGRERTHVDAAGAGARGEQQDADGEDDHGRHRADPPRHRAIAHGPAPSSALNASRPRSNARGAAWPRPQSEASWIVSASARAPVSASGARPSASISVSRRGSPSRHGVHLPHDSCALNSTRVRTISATDAPSGTPITPPVPADTRPRGSRGTSRRAAGTTLPDGPPTSAPLSGRPLVAPPPMSSSSARSVPPVRASTTPGRLIGPDSPNTFVPGAAGVPSAANHAPPRATIEGTAASVSTLLMTVGRPQSPDSTGNGGRVRG